MLLIVTNKTDYTADFLILELQKQGVEFVRFNTEDFPLSIELSVDLSVGGDLDGYFNVYGKQLAFSDIGSIWYRRPVAPSLPEPTFDRVAQDFITTESRYTLDSIWRVLNSFWVSHPDKLRAAETKLHQLIKAVQLGLTVPHTLISTSPEKVQGFYTAYNRQIIYKPQRYIQVDGDERVDLIYTNLVDEEKSTHFDEVRFVPSLFQNYIPKASELRITVISNNVLTVQIHSQELKIAEHDWRRANSTELRHTPYNLPEEISRKCVALVQSYGLAFGAIDMILTPDGEYVFLEMNPNGQWAWIEQRCPEIHIREALIELLVKQDRTQL